MRVLITGWPSFRDGEATAGDVLSMHRIHQALTDADIASDLAWSPVFRPDQLSIEDAQPSRYSHLVFVCGPAHGEQVNRLHQRYRDCRRIAVGVSVIDPGDAAVTGFHHVLARDGIDAAKPDLSLSAPTSETRVVGVLLAPGQAEYGRRRRHNHVHQRLTGWLARQDVAPLPLDTRLDTGEWRQCATADQFQSLLTRLDGLVTTRLHGLVLGLRVQTPVLAVDPVTGGGKLSAQAQALDWPAVLSAETLLADDGEQQLDHWWRWCHSEPGHQRVAEVAAAPAHDSVTELLLAELRR